MKVGSMLGGHVAAVFPFQHGLNQIDAAFLRVRMCTVSALPLCW